MVVGPRFPPQLRNRKSDDTVSSSEGSQRSSDGHAQKRGRPPSLEERLQDLGHGGGGGGGVGGSGGATGGDGSGNFDEEPRVGLLPGVRPEVFDQLQQGSTRSARRARREVLTMLTAEEKIERRKERAKAYSALARKRQESNMKELALELERLNVYRLLVDELADCVLVLSADPDEALVLFANPSCQDYLGVPPEALLGQSLWTLVVAEDKPLVVHALRQIVTRNYERARAQCRLQTRHRGLLIMDMNVRYGTQGILASMRPSEASKE